MEAKTRVDKRGRRGARDQAAPSELIENVVKINRCATVVKGGRRFSFSALAVVGDGKGRVGWGYGKAKDVATAVNKALTKGRRRMVSVRVVGNTIPHETIGQFCASRVFMKPASRGTGIIAGTAVRSVVEAAGVKDVLTKSFGSNNPINLVKAAFEGLLSLRTIEEVERLRGVTLR